MRSFLACALLVGLVGFAGGARALEPDSPEDVLMRYLRALKDNKPSEAYDLTSKALRQGKDKEVWIKEQQAMMGMADVKIFDFTVYPGKVAGDKAQVPNVLGTSRFERQSDAAEHRDEEADQGDAHATSVSTGSGSCGRQ